MSFNKRVISFNGHNQKIRKMGLRMMRDTEITVMETKIEDLLWGIAQPREQKESLENQVAGLKAKNKELDAQLALMNLQEPILAFSVM